MEYEELKRNVGKAGLSLRKFADMIGANPNSITNMKASNDVPKHIMIIAALLGELAENKIDYTVVFERLEIPKQKARNMNPAFKFKNLNA